jgi:hypothetical protein
MSVHSLDEIEQLTRKALEAHGADPVAAAEMARAVRVAKATATRSAAFTTWKAIACS